MQPETKQIGNLLWQTQTPRMSWTEAVEYANGTDGWRLPTVQELVGLWDYESRTCPHFDVRQLTGGPLAFWSATPSKPAKDYPDRAYFVGFVDGSVSQHPVTGQGLVRLVRTVDLK